MDITFHYPPELFKLLTDVIPKLCKSKNDLLLFFRGSGVSQNILQPYVDLLERDKSSFNKYIVTRKILEALNLSGEATLRERRELLKRVSDIESFTICWDNDQAAARGLVAQIRDLINKRDTFTRMKNAKDEERQKRIAEQEAIAAARVKQNTQIEQVKAHFFALFSEPDAHKRGKALEVVLNNLFLAYGILVREAFTITGRCGEGIIEQIDGVIELEGTMYLVELKWWKTPIGVSEISPHLVRIFNRGNQVRGLFISYTEYTSPAIATCCDALNNGAVVILSCLQEIVTVLNTGQNIAEWIKKKAEAALLNKQPYHICP